MSAISIQRAPQNHGEVFTRRWVVETLLDLTGYTADRDLGALTAVEPAAGSGAFLVPMIQRLVTSAASHGRGPHTLSAAIRAWELQAVNVAALRSTVRQTLVDLGVPH